MRSKTLQTKGVEVLTVSELERELEELHRHAQQWAVDKKAVLVRSPGLTPEGYEKAAAKIPSEAWNVYVKGVYRLLERTEEEARPSVWQLMAMGAGAMVLGLMAAAGIVGMAMWFVRH